MICLLVLNEGGNNFRKSYSENIGREEDGSEKVFPTQMTHGEKNMYSNSRSKEG